MPQQSFIQDLSCLEKVNVIGRRRSPSAREHGSLCEKYGIPTTVLAMRMEVQPNMVDNNSLNADSRTPSSPRKLVGHTLSVKEHWRERCVSPSKGQEALPERGMRRKSTHPHSNRYHRREREVIQFHQESCRLFQSFDVSFSPRSSCILDGSQLHSQPSISEGEPCFHGLDSGSIRSCQSKLGGAAIRLPSPDSTGKKCQLSLHSLDGKALERSNESSLARSFPMTILTWTSDESRRVEYEKIDRSHSGFRGLWKQAMPRWCHSKNARRDFYDGGGDGDSVRRFRMSLPDDKGKENTHPRRPRLHHWAQNWSCM